MGIALRCGVAAVFLGVVLFSRVSFGLDQLRSQLRQKFLDGDIPAGQDFTLDLNGDGVGDFVFTWNGDGSVTVAGVSSPTSVNHVMHGNGDILRLSAGDEVGPAESFGDSGEMTGHDWAGQSGFLGVSFDIGGSTHYGFVEMSVGTPGDGGYLITTYGAGWEDQADTAVRVSEVPEAGTVGVMGLGMVGLMRRRRSE